LTKIGLCDIILSACREGRKIHLGREAPKEVLMTKKHEIVGKDWVVTDVVITFCRQFGLPFKQGGLNITYQEVTETTARAVVRVVSWPEGVIIEMYLQDDPEYNAWRVHGELKIFGSPTWFPVDSEGVHFRKHVVGGVARTAFTVHPPRGAEDSYSFEERELAGSGRWYLTYFKDHPMGAPAMPCELALSAITESKAIEEARDQWNQILRDLETPMTMADEETPYDPSVIYKIPF